MPSFSNFKNIDKYEKKLEFKINDVDLSVVNSIRRIILAEIPCIAFYFDAYDKDDNSILIKKNTGVLHNEFLAHRISLIPLYFNEDEINTFDPKKYKFVLHEKNNDDETKIVTTKNFKIFQQNDKDITKSIELPDSFREHVFPKCPITEDHILITKLRPNLYDNKLGEEIDIECVASVGIAKQHARWCAVSQCSYYNSIDVTLVDKAIKEQSNGLSNEEKTKLEKKFETIEKYRYFKKNKYDEPNEFEFTIQTECRLTPKQIFGKAINILNDNVNNFMERCPTLNIINTPNFIQVEIKNENHTLLNVLQSMIYNINLKNNPDTVLDYIGYFQNHALEETMTLKLKFKQDVDVVEFLQNSCKDIITYIKTLKEEWISASA